MTRWIPDDQELDGVARELAPPAVDRDRLEQTRTSLLARATLVAPSAARAWPKWLAAGGALAAAAAIAIWLVAAPRGPKHAITALGPASYERARDWPDFIVHVSDGRVEVRVAALGSDERFRVVTGDAEVEVRGSSFEVLAEHDRLRAVQVQLGRAEVRMADQQVVVLAAGQRWTAPAIARADVVPPASAAVPAPSHAQGATPAMVATSRPAHDAAIAATSRHAAKPANTSHPDVGSLPTPSPPSATVAIPIPPTPPKTVSPSAPSALPGELDFRAGWAALRANDAGTAAGKFETACTAALHTALGEDACFWAGAAAKRANDTAHARAALERFIASFPGSSRVGEASALLGWILLDAGDASGATSAFHRAEQDRVPRVRDSAAKGLAALRGEH